MVVEFAIDKRLKTKIDLMIKRITDDDENDNYLIFEGDTGSGKTNASVGVAYLVSQATGRTFDNSRIFFDTGKAVDFAKTTREQIIIFDEPAFGGLKAEWRKKTQIDLIKLLYTARIKRHFVIFNLVKFSKFSDDIIEKAIALIRIYKRNESTRTRRFIYIPHKKLHSLLEHYHRKHIRAYSKFSIMHGTLFRYVLPEIIDKEEYNKLKEESIANIGIEDRLKQNESRKSLQLQYGIAQFVKDYKIMHKYIAPYLGIAPNTLSDWLKIDEKHGISLGIKARNRQIATVTIDKRVEQPITN